ncbi:IclR family transcriptional regulator [Bradyrhizobium sp. 145]|uniref:IclR family transcriptional regulator n=1 Tax=Bradyrhizobium sp. 145 TaxID=2782621 RepID=UPI001FF88CB8|nr:IclR family transcriptional regulator [Bradyrhizobium sp. 145]MCK1691089.1 IclR family transcriptional regulator [Bradyrhizobium sp. 145]
MKMRIQNATGAHSPLFVNSVNKAVAVLNAFSRERPVLTLTAIARLAALDKGTAQRYLYTLQRLGLVRESEQTKRYSLSVKLLDFCYAYGSGDDLIERAQPFMVDAHEKSTATVNLMVLDGADIILVARIPSRHVSTTNIQVGFRMPALYSATGRAIVSRLDRKERDRVIRNTEYHPYTDKSVSGPGEVRILLDRAAREGFVLTQSQYFQGDISIASAVVGRSSSVVGAISLSVQEVRVTLEEATKKLIPLTMETARKVSRAMGAPSSSEM